MGYEQILTELRGRVGIITLNQPDKFNAMSGTMQRELQEQIRAWNTDDSVGAVVITGAGRGFCSGARWCFSESTRYSLCSERCCKRGLRGFDGRPRPARPTPSSK